MKKVLFLLAATLIISVNLSGQSGAQGKGVILIKGASNLNISFADGTPIELSAGSGYFLWDNVAIGGDLSFTSQDGESLTNLKPWGRYYFKEKFFAGAGLAINGLGEEESDSNLELEGGYLFYLNDYITIEPTVTYPLVDEASLNLNVAFVLYY